MGFKRPFDSDEFQELPFKQARQLDFGNNLTQFAHLYKTTSLALDVTDDYDRGFVKSQHHHTFENNTVFEVPNFSRDIEISAPLSLVTSSSSDEDVGSRAAAAAYPYSQGHSEFDFPRRFVPFEDAYCSYLDRSPRRQVPLGPNHQASIPIWGGHLKNPLEREGSFNPNSYSLVSESNNDIYNDNEERMMGTCIMPMPDAESSENKNNEAGNGRTDCCCLDEGSVRCVRQHVMEAREKLKNSLGYEKFEHLGFYDMGEEVTRKWSEEDQRAFHAVVYSNPASFGQNFWKQLSQVFATRSTKEIVSYYFNVFMLRRRAAQNRSNLLDIDSDDDELHGINRGSYKVQVSEEDDDSDIDSVDQNDHADHRDNIPIEDDDDDDDDDDHDGDEDLGDGGGDATGEDSGIDYVSETPDTKSFDGSRLNAAAVEHVGNNAGIVREDFTVQDDSCMSFEFQADKDDSCDPGDTGAALQVNSATKSDNRACLPGNGDEYSDAVDHDHVYLLDPCDAKAWDARYTVPIKGVELLPTCNMIEEIFGQGTSSD
ncbi:hypothetical protein JCGZ_15691 [Jatropha curcas]|uniref:Myb-like domain-containing protein n=1 Tax=Jatropha curcas TaxID=180498 RepID=A0A067LB22_JATCU|nr:uncharacterized protein LOC105630528 [Jatropha curcas]KDP41284.1 hypothetical protein JCGZ_15691 [Jatropha curcas]